RRCEVEDHFLLRATEAGAPHHGRDPRRQEDPGQAPPGETAQVPAHHPRLPLDHRAPVQPLTSPGDAAVQISSRSRYGPLAPSLKILQDRPRIFEDRPTTPRPGAPTMRSHRQGEADAEAKTWKQRPGSLGPR